jgi:hypothetical protein
MIPFALWNGLRSWPLAVAVCVLCCTLSAFAWWLVARPRRRLPEMVIYAALNAVLVGVLTRIFGPFTIVPALACVITMSITSYPVFARRTWILVTCVTVGWIVPIGLELAGWAAPTWEIEGDGIRFSSNVLALHGSVTSVLVFLTSLFLVLIAGFLSASIARAHLDAKHRLVTQAWLLRQLIPVAG